MKRKLLYLLSMIITSTLVFTSCDDEAKGTVYDLGQERDYVSFLIETQSFNVSNDQTKIIIDAYHINKNVLGTTANISVDYSPEAKDLFAIASTQLTFTDENPVPIEITFDPEKLEFNVDYVLTIHISADVEEYPLLSDIKTTEVKIKRALTFSELGEGTFISEFMEDEWNQPILSADQVQMYRLPDLYQTDYPVDITLNGDGTITIAPQPAWWYDNDFGDVYVEGAGIIEGNILKMEIDHYIPEEASFGIFYEELILPE